MTENCFFPALKRRMAIAASLLAFTAASYPALAQTSTVATDDGHNYSSSTDWKAYLDADGMDGSASPAPAPKPAAGQYGSNNRYPGYGGGGDRWSHLAIEAGGGFTAPIGNDVRDGYDTWGYNVTAGAGWNFTKHIGALLEYQFNRNKIPGATLAAIGAPGGNINTWSLTIDPIIYLPVSKSMGAYVTGGGGFYRKVTNFTAPEEEEYCYYFCEVGYVNETIGHFSSNQGGLNIGVGGYWKAFGPDSRAKLYAEARYVWVDSPAATATANGEGSEGLIPVTFGIRF
jgi:Outer membrane protein beta-barrel domain